MTVYIKKINTFLFILFLSVINNNTQPYCEDIVNNYQNFRWVDSLRHESGASAPAQDQDTTTPPIETLPTRDCGPDIGIPESVIAAANELLQQDLYLRTNPIVQRNFPIDFPIAYFLGCKAFRWQPSISFLYNQTTQGFFTHNGTFLDSYLALNNPDLIGKIDQVAFGLGTAQIFSLLRNVKIQERRAALFFTGAGFKGNWYLEAQIPVLYVAKNFHLTAEEKRALENELFSDDQEEKSEFDNFTREHLISDQIGIGDLRFYAGKNLIKKSMLNFMAGFLATLPTALPFAKGLYGTHFPKNNLNPTVNFVSLFNLALENPEQLQQEVTQLLLAALDKLSANLLQPTLGNNGHVGVGIFGDTTVEATSRLSLRTRAALEYLLPASEQRFYLKKKSRAEFESFNTDTPENCQAEIAFLQQQFINTLFPSIFNTTVFPGFIFKFNTLLTADMTSRWKFNLGYDLWWQQGEGLGKVSSGNIPRFALRPDISTKSDAFQNKIFGSIVYSKKGDIYDWCLSMYGDRTFLSSTIGKDFTLGMRFEFLF